MSRAEPLTPPLTSQPAGSPTGAAARGTSATSDTPDTPDTSLRESVTRTVRAYLAELDGQISTDVYQMVLAEIEAPLLEEIMAYTRNNQTRASHMLGLNRGTLRKKLKQYNLIAGKR